MRSGFRFLTTALALTLAGHAQSSGAVLPGVTLSQGKGSASLTAPLQIVILLTLLTLLPAIIMSVTPTARVLRVPKALKTVARYRG